MADALTPDPGDFPVNKPVSVDLGPQQEATVRFTPEQRTTKVQVRSLLISKFSEMSYSVKLDGSTAYGPAPIPPGDIDRGGPTFMPPKEFQQSMTVRVRNLNASQTRTVHVQPVGWEEI